MCSKVSLLQLNVLIVVKVSAMHCMIDLCIFKASERQHVVGTNYSLLWNGDSIPLGKVFS